MSKCFEIEISKNPEDLITQAKQDADKIGINFNGNSCSGTFVGQGIEGEYQRIDDTLEVTINKKPMILPWPMIETSLKKFFVS